MAFIHHDGSLRPKPELIAGAGNPTLRYGHGFFETMRWENGRIVLWEGHVRRMNKALQLLHMSLPAHFNEAFLLRAIEELAGRNGHETARVRVQFYLLGSASEDNANSSYFMETEEVERRISETYSLCLYPHAAKSADIFSTLKHCNYLPYSLASRYASAKGYDDALVLNSHGQVCDSSRANIFMIRGEKIFTPSLEAGCIAGVFREYLLKVLSHAGEHATECSIHPDELNEADEIFLTNSVRGIMPVHEWEGKKMRTTRSADLAARHSLNSLLLTGR